MKHRNPLAVIFFSIITVGIYAIVWEVKTKNEMNKLGAEIPTAWLLIIPIVSIYWTWKYSKGVEHVTGGKTSGILAFVLLYLLSIIGMAIVQDIFNGLPAAAAANAAAPSPAAPSAGTPASAPAAFTAPAPTVQPTQAPQPDSSFGGPATPAVTPEAVSSPPESPNTPAPTPPSVQ